MALLRRVANLLLLSAERRVGGWLLLWLLPVAVGATEISNLRMWPEPGSTRLVFDLTEPDGCKVFSVSGPDRIVIDFETAKTARPLQLPMADPDIIASLRHAPRESGTRIVIDVRTDVEVSHRLLEPRAPYGHRLVVDLRASKPAKTAMPESAAERAAAPTVVATPSRIASATPAALPDLSRGKADRFAGRDVIVAIDAGHGGEDVGAIGPGGSYEKNITHQVARELAKLIDSQRGMKAVLTRNGDYYVGLRQRTEIARAQKADLFVSIHADAFRDRRVAGGSVYVVSSKGASSTAAQWLADSENASDLVGGVTLSNKDGTLQSVLLRMSQSATLDGSIDVAQSILASLRRVGTVHKNYVERAGFVVLKSPDIPSVLVELAFISNPAEEKKLNDPVHRQKLARAVLSGVSGYFDRHAAPGTLLAELRRSGQGSDPILALVGTPEKGSMRSVGITASLP
ncbi:MAG: N-acetylmuramoyl-L-alanine amidase [Gammaproteobacteria bacterium]|nr:N-acetylmuramoyl-L-alanine amidase [Gammaproteobacteria bacterium]